MKNKRIILVVLSVVIGIAMLVSMGGCSLLEIILGGSSGTISDDSIEITVYNDDIPATFKVKGGEENEITAFTKPGYYLTGYYSEKSGGTKYFDTEGKSVSIWQKTNPTTLYAQWNENSQLDKYNGSTIFTTKSIELAYVNSKITYFEDIPAEYINAAKGNFEEVFDISITLKLKGPTNSNYNVYLCDKSDSDREYFGTKPIKTADDNYTEYELNYVAKAGFLKFGKIYIEIDPSIGLYQRAYVKDISYTIQYHQPSQDDITE